MLASSIRSETICILNAKIDIELAVQSIITNMLSISGNDKKRNDDRFCFLCLSHHKKVRIALNEGRSRLASNTCLRSAICSFMEKSTSTSMSEGKTK